MKGSYGDYITGAGIALSAIKTISDGMDNSINLKQYNGKGVTCHPGAGGQVSLYYEYKSRRPSRGSKYDKTNCAHGTLVQKDFVYGTSTIGRKHLWENGADRTAATQMQTIHNTFFNTTTAQAIAPERVGGLNTINTEKFTTSSQRQNHPLMFEWIKRVTYLSNANVQGCEVDIYNLICKDDTNVSPYSQLVADVARYGSWQLDATRDNFITGVQGPTSETESSFNLEKNPTFRKYWGICSKATVFLKPGEIIKNTTFFRTRYLYTQLDKEESTYIKGVSHCTIALVKGRIAHSYDGTNAATADPSPPNQTPTFAGTHIDTTTETSYYVRQHTPFRNYYYLEIGNWNQEGQAIRLAETVEEEGPGEQIGE